MFMGSKKISNRNILKIMLKQILMVEKMLHKFGKIKLEQNLKEEKIINPEQVFGKKDKKN